MLRWSLNLFRVRGIQLALHFSFFLLVGVNAFVGWSEGGMAAAVWYTALLLGCFTCVVLHEFGHCFAAMRYGIRVRRILLMPIGGMAEFEEIPREPRRELVITLAGPAVNFAIAALLWLALPRIPFLGLPGMTSLDFAQQIILWNLLMGAFNFLPAFPMDGGRVLRALLATRTSYLRATFWAATVGKILCAAGMMIAPFYEPMLLLLFGFIFLVGEMEYRAVKQRELAEAEWRALLSRQYLPPPPLNEPPLLTR